MRWGKFEQISFGVGKTVNHSFSRGKVINIGIQVGSLNNDQPHYFPHLSKLLSFFPLVFSGWIQSLEASEVYFKITAILSIEHPPDKPKASEIISDSITFYTWMRLFLGLFICLFVFIQGLVEKFIFELCVEEDYLYSIRLIHTLIHTLPQSPPATALGLFCFYRQIISPSFQEKWPKEASYCAQLQYFQYFNKFPSPSFIIIPKNLSQRRRKLLHGRM